jgi:hypothetical protein
MYPPGQRVPVRPRTRNAGDCLAALVRNRGDAVISLLPDNPAGATPRDRVRFVIKVGGKTCEQHFRSSLGVEFRELQQISYHRCSDLVICLELNDRAFAENCDRVLDNGIE